MQPGIPSIVDLAQAKPPQSLSNFQVRFVPTPPESDGVQFVSFELSCPICLAGAFQILELSATLGPMGIVARCRQCGREEQVFNAATDGYDGSFGHLEFLKEGVSAAPLEDDTGAALEAVQVRAAFSYSIPLAELMEHAQDAHLDPQDLFDWFHLLTKTADAEGWDWVWEFECA